MSDYIRREDARRMVVQLDKYAWKSPVSDERRVTVDVDLVKFGLDRIPAADVAEVVHGRWISFLDGDHIMPERYYRCTRCGRVESRRQPYCHCGAKMDGAAE